MFLVFEETCRPGRRSVGWKTRLAPGPSLQSLLGVTTHDKVALDALRGLDLHGEPTRGGGCEGVFETPCLALHLLDDLSLEVLDHDFMILIQGPCQGLG